MANTITPAGMGQDVLPVATERLKEDASTLLDTAKSELSQLKSEAEAQVGAVTEEAKAEFGKMADKAKGLATDQKDMLAEQVDTVAQAVSKVAGELEANDFSTAGYARTISDTVNQFSETLKTKDVDQLLSMAEDFGRKQPAAFAGVMAIAGFAASRFLLASAKRRQATEAEKAPVAFGSSYDSGPAPYGGASTSSPYSHTSGSSRTSSDPMGGEI